MRVAMRVRMKKSSRMLCKNCKVSLSLALFEYDTSFQWGRLLEPGFGNGIEITM